LLYGYLDASALANRYVPEIGTREVNHLFARMPADRLVVLNVGAAEVVSLLVRKRNAGRITAAVFRQVMADFVAEIVVPAYPVKVPADDARVFAAFPLIDTHSLNAADAILLRSALDLAGELRAPATTCWSSAATCGCCARRRSNDWRRSTPKRSRSRTWMPC